MSRDPDWTTGVTVDPTLPQTGSRPLGDELRGATVERLLPVDRSMYAMMEEFARGGLGRIFRALDRRTGRIVAIKEVRLAEREVLQRFAREALVTANLQHPSIVPVYEVGRWSESEPFYAMKLVQGRTLADLVAEAATGGERLALLPHVIDVADALAYAHSERVIHRDLKPANVLVGSYGETVVIDWGLARNLATGEEAASLPSAPRFDGDGGETVAGTVMGTPAYMPPEQARGEVVDERADVYAIGAMLYHVLAGLRPYAEASGAAEVLGRVIEGPPKALSELAPEIPAELVAIVDRAMAPLPSDRYPTAQGLAEDLRRFQTGQLVRAHHYTPWQLVSRWVRRHRALVVTTLAAASALAAFGAYSFRRIAAERDEAARQRSVAVSARALSERRLGDGLEELARQALLAGDPARALPLLAGSWGGRPEGPPTLRFLSARALDAYAGLIDVAPAQRGGVLWAALTPDGALLLSAGFSQLPPGLGHGRSATAVVPRGPPHRAPLPRRPPRSGRERRRRRLGLRHLRWNAPGRPGRLDRRALAGRGLVTRRRPLRGRRSRRNPPRLDRLPSMDLGDQARRHASKIRDVRFSPDGARLASTGDDGRVLVWDARTMAAPTALSGHQGHVNSLAWAGSDTLVSGGDDGAVIAWDVASAQPRRTFAGGAAVYRVTVDPSGTLLAAAVVDPAVPVWNLRTGERVASLPGHHGSANDAEFIGARLLTTDEAGVLRTWDAARGELDGVLPGDGVIFGVRAHDGGMVLAGESASIRVASLAPSRSLRRMIGHRARVRSALFDASGAVLYTASNDGTARAWDVATGVQRFTVGAAEPQPEAPLAPDATVPPPNPQGVRCVALSPDGRTLATSSEDGTVALWDASTGASQGSLDGHQGRVREVIFSRDGASALTFGFDGDLRLWDLGPRRERSRISTGAPVLAARLDESSRRAIVLGENGAVTVWDAVSGAKIDDGSLPESRLVDLPVTPRGEVVGAQPAGVFLVDPASARVTREIPVSMVSSASVSPDGRALALGSSSGDVSLVDLASGAVTRSWHALDGVVVTLRFRPGDGFLAVLGTDRIARVWEPASGRLLAAAPPFPDVATALRWSPDGRRLVVSGMATQAWVWLVAPYEGDAAGFARRARCVSPLRLDGTGVTPAPPDPAACRSYGVLTGSGAP
ncbi:MAG: protein kinase [Deltaproteobacteria bacterium]|nr:protein kinase [Deltaproteobacteria bacterium]